MVISAAADFSSELCEVSASASSTVSAVGYVVGSAAAAVGAAVDSGCVFVPQAHRQNNIRIIINTLLFISVASIF